MNDAREALHAAVEDLCEGKDREALLRKWMNTLTNAEAIIMSQEESYERDKALERLTECAMWFSIVLTDAHAMGARDARRTVRRMPNC